MREHKLNSKAKAKRWQPPRQRRTECSSCDQWSTCRDVGGSWLCPTCEAEAEATAFACS